MPNFLTRILRSRQKETSTAALVEPVPIDAAAPTEPVPEAAAPPPPVLELVPPPSMPPLGVPVPSVPVELTVAEPAPMPTLADLSAPAFEEPVSLDEIQLNPPLPSGRFAAQPRAATKTPRAPKKAAARARRARSPSLSFRPKKRVAGDVTMKHKSIVHARIVNVKPAVTVTNGHHGANGHAPSTGKEWTANTRPDPEASLAWLQFLAKSVHAGGLHLMLAYYRRLGWIPKGAYGWLRDLAAGVGRQMNRLTWDSLRIEPDRLIEIHAKSYRALQELFPPMPTGAPMQNGNHAVALVAASSKRRN